LYISLNDFILESKRSDSTIRKFIKEIGMVNSTWVRTIKNRYYLNKRLLEYFLVPYKMSVSYFVFTYLNKSKRSKTRSLSESMLDHLKNKEWNYFGHISYEKETSMMDCMYLFDKVIKRIKKMVKCDVEIFYTSERNKIRNKGYHSHFVLYTSNLDENENIKNIIESFFRRNALGLTDITKYIKELDGLKYIMKDINVIKDGYGLIST
jgi:hypothetical protein